MNKKQEKICDALGLCALVLIVLGGIWNVWSYLALGTLV